METFKPYLDKIDDPDKLARVVEILQWVSDTFPELGKRIAWNQPMFTHHDTFIIAFSMAKQHLAVSPEYATLKKFGEELDASGYDYTTMLFRIPWKSEVNYPLLKKMIEYNIEDKADCKTFWRPASSWQDN